jgi:hypothetical protein
VFNSAIREVAAEHAVESRFLQAPDEAVTARMLENLGPLIGALKPIDDAVIRVGALLLVKVDGVLTIVQLTAAQQLKLDHEPSLVRSPQDVLSILRSEEQQASNADYGEAGSMAGS